MLRYSHILCNYLFPYNQFIKIHWRQSFGKRFWYFGNDNIGPKACYLDYQLKRHGSVNGNLSLKNPVLLAYLQIYFLVTNASILIIVYGASLTENNKCQSFTYFILIRNFKEMIFMDSFKIYEQMVIHNNNKFMLTNKIYNLSNFIQIKLPNFEKKF